MYLVSVSGAKGADVPHAWKRGYVNQGGAGAEVVGLLRLWWGAELWIIVGQQGEYVGWWSWGGVDHRQPRLTAATDHDQHQ